MLERDPCLDSGAYLACQDAVVPPPSMVSAARVRTRLWT